MAGLLALKVGYRAHYSYAANVRPDASSREQAFMSGFAHQIFRLQELPEELASWMIDQSKDRYLAEKCIC